MYRPGYNILQKAGSTLGYKHTEETLAKFKLRKPSEESLEKLRFHLSNLNPILGEQKRIEVMIYDFEEGINNLYASVTEAAKAINTDTKTIWIKSNIDNKEVVPFRGRYVITKLSEGLTKENHLSRVELTENNLTKGLEDWKNNSGKKVAVTNIETNETLSYNTVSNASVALDTSRRTIIRRIEDKKVFNKIYKISYA